MGLLASADGAGAIVTGIWLAFGRGPRRQGAYFAGGSVLTAALVLSATPAESRVSALGLIATAGSLGTLGLPVVFSFNSSISNDRFGE